MDNKKAYVSMEKSDLVNTLVDRDSDLFAKDKKIKELEVELQYLKDCETTWIKMCERKGKNIENLKAEMARLNRHISMQNLTISKMKNELDGIPETTPYSNTAKLGQNNFEIIASGKVSGE